MGTYQLLWFLEENIFALAGFCCASLIFYMKVYLFLLLLFVNLINKTETSMLIYVNDLTRFLTC
jgi:hypothetical protein